MVADGTSWVAVAPASSAGAAEGDSGGAGADEVVGFMRLDGVELDQLYIRPGWWGRGIGSRLIEHAKAQSPDGLTLWTFQVNERALGFYAHHGFIELLRTDGSGNEERQPDVRLGWRPPMRDRSRGMRSTPARRPGTSGVRSRPSGRWRRRARCGVGCSMSAVAPVSTR